MSKHLETKRLVLTRGTMKDYVYIIRKLKDKKLAEMMNADYPIGIKELFKGGFNMIGLGLTGIKVHTFIIKLKSSGEKMGSITIVENKHDRIAELGMWILKKWRKDGYMSEAFSTILNFAFGELGLRKVFSIIIDKNAASIKLHKKFGFILEGKLREGIINKATKKVQTEHYYGLLKREWKKIHSKLKNKLH